MKGCFWTKSLSILAIFIVSLSIVGCQPTSAPAATQLTPTSVEAAQTPVPTPSPPIEITLTPTVKAPLSPAEVACKPAAEGNAPAYKDPAVCLDDRVEDLLARMTLAEKIGQMTQVEIFSIQRNDISAKFIGSILSGGDGNPPLNTPAGWLEMVNGLQQYTQQTRLGIPLIYGVDSVHGHAHVVGAVVFPHNVGLGATRDPDLVERIGQVTATEMAATGVYWNFAPTVAVPQDIRWGRTYEGFSENTELVSQLGAAYLKGLQTPPAGWGAPLYVLATPKHFVGDGGTKWGTSTAFKNMLDQGVTDIDEAALRAIHLPPYQQALNAGAMSIMVSYSSWGGQTMHAQKYLLTDVLKNELGFKGLLISDWGGIDHIPGDYYSSVVTAINAGIDVNMVPYGYELFIKTLTQAVNNGDVSQTRLDDAVRRILRVKFMLGLFERPLTDETLLSKVGAAEHRQVAREAVRKSLVLLKNENKALPLDKNAPLILVGGRRADDLGSQCGGWTVTWQGQVGDITEGTTILEAIKQAVSPDTKVEFDLKGESDKMADVGIAVVGERPYSEGKGDSDDLSLSSQDIAVIEQMRRRSQILIVILISGRPMIITEQLPPADAFVAAWLPGSEGQGIADALFGDYPFTGKLPYTWPRSMSQLPFDFKNLPKTGCDAPLFPLSYGLDTSAPGAVDWRDCPPVTK